MMKLQGPVLVGTAFNAASAETLRQGYDLASDLGTSLIVFHVVPHLDTVNLLFPQLAARNAQHRQKLSDKAMAAIERQVETTLSGIPGISIRPIDDLQSAAQGRLREALIRFGIDGEPIATSGPTVAQALPG